MPVSSGYLLKTIVDPTMFFTIVVEGKPVNCISFKTASWDLKKRNLVIRLPPSHNYSRTWVTGGDFTCHSGTDGKSFYRETFEDGNFIQENMEPAILFMANADPRIKDSQIFICITKPEWSDGKHVVSQKGKVFIVSWKPWHTLGPGMTKPSWSSPLLTWTTLMFLTCVYLNRQITPSIAKKSILHSICLLYPGIFAPTEGFEVPYFLLLPPSLGRS